MFKVISPGKKIRTTLMTFVFIFIICTGLIQTAEAGEATLSWNPNSEPDLAGYKVYYGTASNTYGTPIDVGNQTTYTVSGLGTGTYYFTVTAYDTFGNESLKSLEVSKTLADTTPPVISAVSVSQITSNSVTVTWTTDEGASSQVDYGTSSAYGSSSPLDGSLVKNHSVAITGLLPSTLYHFRVASQDGTGNLAVSVDDTFTTSSLADTTPPVISGISVSQITSTSATVTWNTDEPASSQVDYGTSSAYGTSSPMNSSLATSHSVTLTGLSSSTSYHFRAVSQDGDGNLAMSGDNTFTTNTAPDTTPPVISAVTASNLSTSSVVITWTTNETATSQVQFGTTTGYGSNSPLDNSLVTSHSVTLSGLSSSTLYHFRVLSSDSSGNTAQSTDNTFTTTAVLDTTPPTISNIQVSGLSSSSATVFWMTNEAATSLVKYGTTASYGITSGLNSTLVTNHSRTLSGLQPNTLYHYQVQSQDGSGNTASSNDLTFTTTNAADGTPPSAVINFQAVSLDDNVALSWTNPSEPDFMGVRILYRTDRFPGDLGTFTGEWGNASTSDYPNTIQDTYIDLNTNNYSGATDLRTYTWPEDQIANAILMKWDLSAVPPNAVIQSATLQLYMDGSGGDGTFDVSVHKIINKNPSVSQATGYTYDGSNPWTSNSCCNGNTPLAQGDIGGAEDTQALSTVTGYKSWNVTQMVQDWILDPNANFGMLVNSDPVASSNSSRKFYSSEHAQNTQRPKLVITYSTGESNVNDGTLLGDFTGQPNVKIAVTHPSPQSGTTYYYAAYSYDGQGNFRPVPVKAQATVGEIESSSLDSLTTIGGCGFTNTKPPSNRTPMDLAMFIIPGLLGLRSLMKRRQIGLKIRYQYLT